MAEPIIMTNFDDAIADSPHKGFGLMRNVDLESFPGAVKVQPKPSSQFHTALSQTFTADAGTDICTLSSGTIPDTGIAVTVSSTGTLPAGLSAATNYFIISVTTSTFKLATTVANAKASTAIDITDAGTGTHTVATVDPGTVNHMIEDDRTGTVFYQDSNARVWYSDGSNTLLLNGNTLTNGEGNGLAILGNSNTTATYLFAFRNGSIDVVDVFGTAAKDTPSWTNGWQSLNSGAGSGNRHHTLFGQDSIIYFTDDRYVGSIQENAGSVFDPGTGATYTYNNQALDLPIFEISEHLEELGTNLLVAGKTFNKIYPWDRVSDSFDIPLTVPENQVFRLKNIGNVIYILAGQWGNVYTTQGTYVRHLKKIPDQIINNSSVVQSNLITWGGIDSLNGALLFGMAVQTSGNSGAYLLYPDGRLVIDNIPSTGSTNAVSFLVKNERYRMGYASGADRISTSRYDNLETVIQDAYRRVATITGKNTYSTLEVILAKPASNGQCRISYREDTTSSFTTLDTFTADGTNETFKNDGIGLSDIENIQLQVEMDEDIELVAVRLLE